MGVSSFEPDAAVMASIKLSRFDALNDCYECGCSLRGSRWFLCQYHEGYGDGYDAASVVSEPTTPLTVALENYVEAAKKRAAVAAYSEESGR